MRKQYKSLLLHAMFVIVLLVLGACKPTQAPATQVPATAAPATQAPATAAPATEVAVEPTAELPLPVVVQMPEQIAGGRPVEITVIGKPQEAQPELLAAWEEQVARFEAMYPNVNIVGTDYAYSPDSFAALVAGGEEPTLFEVYLTDPGKMIDQGVAADLTPFFKQHGLDKVFNPNILAITSRDGKIYGIPRFAYAMGLAYNGEMLREAGYDQPPSTWEELAEMAVKLTNRDAGVAGLSFITDGGNATGWHATVIAYNFGLKNTDIVAAQPDGTYKAGFDNDAMIRALNFIKDLRWTYDVLPRENLDWPRNGEALATERAAMVVMAGDQYIWIRQTFADVDINKFGFAPLPAGPGGQSVSLVGGNIAMVSSRATPDQIEAAVYWRLWWQFDPAEILSGYEAARQDPTVVVGAPVLPLYVGEYQQAYEALQRQYANLPVENYKPFLDGITSGRVGLMPEPLVAGQEYYGAMGAVVSTIVADQTADPAALVREAVATFQTNVLDLLNP